MIAVTFTHSACALYDVLSEDLIYKAQCEFSCISLFLNPPGGYVFIDF